LTTGLNGRTFASKSHDYAKREKRQNGEVRSSVKNVGKAHRPDFREPGTQYKSQTGNHTLKIGLTFKIYHYDKNIT
jgi:hypothetical protein